MSYDFSFEKGQMWLLGALAVLMSVLLVAAGFLWGRISLVPSYSTTASSAGAPVVTATPATSLRTPSVSTPVGSVQAPLVIAAPAPVAVTQLTPSAASSTVDISNAPAPEVYQLAATGYALQYGAFRDGGNARDLLKQLKEQKVIASVVTMQNAYGETYSVVRSSPYPTVADAREAAVDQANRLGMPIVVRPAGRL